MKYCVMFRGRIALRTNDIAEARKKIETLGRSAYILYGEAARQEYAA